MITTKEKRKCLLTCARKGLLLAAVNRRLEQESLAPVNQEQWNLWRDYFVDIVRNDPYFEHELIDNDRSLAWFAKEVNQRRSKFIAS